MNTDFNLYNKKSPIGDAIKDKKRRDKKIQSDRLKEIQDFYDKCIYHRYGTDETPCPNDYKTGTVCGNMVGDRIRFILKKENLTIKYLADWSRVARSSLHRFLDAEEPDIPKAETLDKIIRALPIHLEDFLYSPEDFEEWKEGYTHGYMFVANETIVDYDMCKKLTLFRLSVPIAYEQDGKKYKMPAHIADLLSKQILSAFETADALLEYEMEKRKPQGYYENDPKVEFVDFFETEI